MKMLAMFVLGAVGLALQPTILSASESNDQVISKTDTLVLTDADYKQALLRIPEQERKALQGKPQMLRQYALRLHSDKALARLAEENGLDKQPRIDALLADARRNILMTAWMEHIRSGVKKPDLETLASERYIVTRQDYKIPERRQVSHIMTTELQLCPCKTQTAEDLINEIYAKLQLGVDFASLAKEYSHDLGSRDAGGLIPTWFEDQSQAGPFQTKVFELAKVGDYSEPFATKQGWHIVQLKDIEESRIPPYDEIATKIQDRIWKELQFTALERARGEQYPLPDTIDVDAIEKLLNDLNTTSPVSE